MRKQSHKTEVIPVVNIGSGGVRGVPGGGHSKAKLNGRERKQSRCRRL